MEWTHCDEPKGTSSESRTSAVAIGRRCMGPCRATANTECVDWCFLQNGRILDVLCMCEPIMPRPSPPPRRSEPSNAVMTKSSTVTRLRHFATVLELVELPAQLRKRSLRSLYCRSDGVRCCSAAVANSFHSASPFIPERGSHHQTVGSNTYCASWTSGFALDPATARNAEIVLLSAVPSGSLTAARRA